MDAKTKQLYKLKANVLAAAGHEIRLAVIDFLRDGEQCVCDIADHVDAQRSNLSRHLAVLLAAGLVSQRKDGLRMLYALKTPCVLSFLDCVTGVLQDRLREQQAVLKSM